MIISKAGNYDTTTTLPYTYGGRASLRKNEAPIGI